MTKNRHSLSDEEWALLAPLLPPLQTAGRPCGDRRKMLEAMLHRLCFGARWRDLPSRFAGT
ncbi:transposase [Caldimonas tepidiphila]|uniref:transposase n=1 Tax=Caldimonas tepidiphila TaxID=2315841 RepID=UPI000E5AB21C